MSGLAGVPFGRARWLPWREGPAADAKGPLVVSLTDFRSHRRRDLPMVYLTGWRLREGWYAMPGAVGLWLWGQPHTRRGGSLSIWESEADLRRFVSLPAHLEIMRHYRSRGVVESATWTIEECDLQLVRRQAEQRLAESPQPDGSRGRPPFCWRRARLGRQADK